MKAFGNMLTGLMLSTFAYTALLFLGISIGWLIGFKFQSQQVLQIGMDFLWFNVAVGMLSGYLGGSNKGYNGAMTGGIIAGILAALVRLILVYAPLFS